MNTVKRFTVALCKANPDTIYVFGDNLTGRGRAGQACIRDEPNAMGIPTKRSPSMVMGSFFGDNEDERVAIAQAILKIFGQHILNDMDVVFPEDGLGTGMAQMEQRSPKLFKCMNKRLSNLFDTKEE